MILTCPRCATRYLVGADQLWTTGRTVQCDACGQRWRASGSGERPAPPAAPLQPPPPDATPEPLGAAEPHPTETENTEPEATDTKPANRTPTAVTVAAPPAEPAFEPVPAFGPLDPSAAAPAADGQSALFRQTPKRAAYSAFGPPGLGRAVAILFLLAMVVAALVLFKDPIVRAAPALAPIYSALGLSNLSLTGVGAHG